MNMRTVVLTLMMLIASTAYAGLYKWVDSEGSVHYSQKPPENKPYSTIKAPPPAPKSSLPAVLNENESEVEKTIKTETAKNQKLREENCAIGKNNLRSYQAFRKIRDKDGNIRVVGKKEREEKIESAKQLIRDFCGSKTLGP